MASPDGQRCYLILVGVGAYSDPDLEALPEVETDLATLRALFVDRLGYRPVLDSLANGCTAAQLRRQLSGWFASRERSAQDIVLVVFAGHGYTSASHQHYLCTSDFDVRNPSDTGLRTADLASLIWEGEGERPQFVWVVADTCYSGQGVGGLLAEVGRAAQQFLAAPRGGFWALAAGRAIDEAHDGRLVQALVAVIEERLDSPAFGAASQRHLGADGLADGINQRLAACAPGQVAQFAAAGVSAEFPFLPNPRYRSGAAGLDLESQDQLERRAELRAHWIPKAQGTELGDTGWFFSGRRPALAALVNWLADDAAPAVPLVVTGDPGSGKSALLARLVTLAHAPTRKALMAQGALEGLDGVALPSVGSIDLALHLRGRSLLQVQASIAAAAGCAQVAVGDTQQEAFSLVLEHLAQRGTRFHLVVDALDESADGERMARELLRPLAALPVVRLVVGTRRPLLVALGLQATVLDLDTAAYVEQADIAACVADRLLRGRFAGQPSPYVGRPEVAAAVAAVVAAVAMPSFLIARLACTGLARQAAAIDTGAAGWQARLRRHLPSTLAEAYDADLARFGPQAQRVRDILRPLAYAEGLGLPWERLWEAVASAMAGRPYGRSDVEQVRRAAASFIVEDQESGRSVYRLFHESFAEYLRMPDDAADVQRRIAAALIASLPRGPGGAADWLAETRPYLRRHLAAHAHAAGQLAALVADPAFLAVADPNALLPLLRTADPAVAPSLRRLYASALHQLRGSAPSAALSYLELAARKVGSDLFDAALAVRHDACRWRVGWAHWLPEAPHRVIATGHQAVTALAALVIDGRPVLVTGGREGTVRVWDLETAVARGEPLQSGGRIWALLAGGPGAPPVLGVVMQVSSSTSRRQLATLDLETGLWRDQGPMPLPYRAGLDGRQPVLLDTQPRRPWRWLVMAAGEPVWRTAAAMAPEDPADRLGWAGLLQQLRHFVDLDGQPLAVLQPVRKRLLLVDPRSGLARRSPVAVDPVNEYILPVVFDAAAEPPCLWVAGPQGIEGVPLRDEAGPPIVLRGSSERPQHLALSVHRDGRTLIAADGPAVRLWDLAETGVDRALQAWPWPAPSALRLLQPTAGTAALAVEAGSMGLLCDPTTGQVRPLFGRVGGARLALLCAGERAGRAALALTGGDGRVRIVDGASGKAMGLTLRHGEDGAAPVQAARFSRWGGQDLLVTVSDDAARRLTVWSLATGRPLVDPVDLADGVVGRTAIVQARGRPLVATVQDERFVRLWDPLSGKPVGTRLRPGPRIAALQAATVDGRDLLLLLCGSPDSGWWVSGVDVDARGAAFRPLPVADRVYVSLAAGRADGRLVVAIGQRTTLSLWTDDRRLLVEVDLDARIRAIVLLPSRRVVVATSKGLVALDWAW